MAKFKVTTISMFKLEYLVEADNAEYAKDSVVCNVDKDEVHQESLGETIVDAVELNTEEYNKFVASAMNGHVADRLTLREDD